MHRTKFSDRNPTVDNKAESDVNWESRRCSLSVVNTVASIEYGWQLQISTATLIYGNKHSMEYILFENIDNSVWKQRLNLAVPNGKKMYKQRAVLNRFLVNVSVAQRNLSYAEKTNFASRHIGPRKTDVVAMLDTLNYKVSYLYFDLIRNEIIQ